MANIQDRGNVNPGNISNAAFGVAWDGDINNTASKNALYDLISPIIPVGGGGTIINVTTVQAQTNSGLSLTDNAGNLGIFIKDGGSIGIGTSTVHGQMTLAGVGTDDSIMQFGVQATATQNFHLGNTGDGVFRLYNGNYGAGTEYVNATGPAATVLKVIGSTSSSIYLSDSGAGSNLKNYRVTMDGGNVSHILLNDDDTTKQTPLYFSSAGNIGISKTSSLLAKLHLYTLAATSNSIYIESETTSDNKIVFKMESVAEEFIIRHSYNTVTTSQTTFNLGFNSSSLTQVEITDEAVAIANSPLVLVPGLNAQPVPSLVLNNAYQYVAEDGGSPKFVIAMNDGGTTRYKYLPLTGTSVTWVHTTSAPAL